MFATLATLVLSQSKKNLVIPNRAEGSVRNLLFFAETIQPHFGQTFA
jgi:hypothetical protein